MNDEVFNENDDVDCYALLMSNDVYGGNLNSL